MTAPEEKIVRFDRYCKLCENWKKKQEEEPCTTCLDNPTNAHSRVPLMYKKKGVDK